MKSGPHMECSSGVVCAKRLFVCISKDCFLLYPSFTLYKIFPRRFQDPIIERIERRIALFTQLPMSHQEDIQILRYTKGQKYGAHYDSAYDTKESGPHHRKATFYMYLSDVEEGGETAFPKDSVWVDPAMGKAADPTFSDCAKGHVAAKPKVYYLKIHQNFDDGTSCFNATKLHGVLISLKPLTHFHDAGR